MVLPALIHEQEVSHSRSSFDSQFGDIIAALALPERVQRGRKSQSGQTIGQGDGADGLEVGLQDQQAEAAQVFFQCAISSSVNEAEAVTPPRRAWMVAKTRRSGQLRLASS